MLVYIQKEARSLEMDFNGTAAALLLQLGISPEVVLVVKDGKLITADDEIADAKRIDLLSVISGG